MLDQAWNFLVEQFHTNQFFSGAALASAIMGMTYQLKSIPRQIWSRVHRLIHYNVFVADKDDLYEALDIYMIKHYSKKLRNVEAKTHEDGISLSHDNDFVRLWFKRRRLTISKRRETLENASASYNRYARSFSVSGYFCKKQISVLLQKALEYRKKYLEEKALEKKESESYVRQWGEWTVSKNSFIKKFKDVYLAEKEAIIKDLEDFKNQEELYKRVGIPFKRGYLFYGSPGNGKSTLAGAIADYMKYDVYALDVSEMTTATDFMNAFRHIPNNSVVVFEDIDAIFTKRKKGDKEVKTNFSTILNALSGINQKQNIITVITTNHVEKLDPALMREGRCDYKLEIKNPSKEIAEQYLSHVFDKPTKLSKFKSRSFVEMQELVLRNIKSENECIKALEK